MTKPKDPTRKLFFQIPAFLAFSIAIWWAYRIGIGSLSGESDIVKQAQFGDMFGGLNALVSMMGFVGLFISLNLQRQQFQASLADMRDNAEAAKAETEAIREQIKEMKYAARVALAQSSIMGRSAHIQNLNGQLATKIAMYDLWVKTKESNAVIKNGDDAKALAVSIEKLLRDLSSIDTSQIKLD